MRISTSFILFLIAFNSWAQGPQVPTRMEFAGLQLKIHESARREIQKDVDALTANPKYLQIKVERANQYFPIIEKVFRSEGLPEDFKYLVIQESALIADVVSVSDAVGFWQFKDFTAIEMGMRVDKQVDQRLDIVASSVGAARYLKKNNLHFDNWVYALQSYQMGAGGAMRALGESANGGKTMDVTDKTYWYVKKFLAHKVAFEHFVGQQPAEYTLMEYNNSTGKTFGDIAKETGVEEDLLRTYNKWLKRGSIPDDRPYTVIVPVKNGATASWLADQPKVSVQAVVPESKFTVGKTFPEIDTRHITANGVVKVNGMPGVVAKAGDKVTALADRTGTDIRLFLKYNDIKVDHRPIENQVYYLQAKKNKAATHHHVVTKGETLWQISQMYGLKMDKLLQKNRMKKPESLKEGRVLWLRFIRPANVPIEYREVPAIQVVPSSTPEKTEVARQSPTNEPPKEQAVNPTAKPEMEITQPPQVLKELFPEPPRTKVEEIPPRTPDLVQITHKVAPKETLYAISKIYNVKILDILEWNNLRMDEGLSIGQELKIIADRQDIHGHHLGSTTSATTLPSSQSVQTYVVQPGDTLYKIARDHGVSIKELMDWNEKKEMNISVGETIKVKP
jgi:membrane-bound lytic murein transglycosylase D